MKKSISTIIILFAFFGFMLHCPQSPAAGQVPKLHALKSSVRQTLDTEWDISGKHVSIALKKSLPAVELCEVRQNRRKKSLLKWKRVSGADGYEIARSQTKNGEYQTIKIIESGKTRAYTDHGPSAGERCYYKVRAFKRNRWGICYGKYSRILDNGIKKETDWEITQYGDASGSQLMFYTLQDHYGHLIIVDGGWPANAEMVRSVIKQKGGHVNAWFLTHPHEDHIGAFCDIYENPKNIKIDKVYAVKMASPRLCMYNAPWDSVAAYERFRAMHIRQLNYVHRGDHLKVGKLKIEILSAYEKKIDDISSDLLNDGSMVFKVYGKEESMLFCADAGKAVSDYLKEKYGSRLKSDYIQMGHHGNGGLKKDLYKIVNPDVAFFDAPNWLMEDSEGRYTTPLNRKIMESMDSRVVSFSTAPNTVFLK